MTTKIFLILQLIIVFFNYIFYSKSEDASTKIFLLIFLVFELIVFIVVFLKEFLG